MSTRGSRWLRSDRTAPLEAWREWIAAGGRVVPHFDPLDGGVDSRVLILLETPGAGMTADDAVSRDNPTGTARNLLRFSAAVVLSGRAAGEAEPIVRAERPGLRVIRMPHPSPTIVCTSPVIGERITAALREAAAEVH